MAQPQTSFTKYYKYLLSTFGNANYKGCGILAHILDMYEDGVLLQDLYKQFGETIHLTPSAVERNIRIYLAAILKDHPMDEIAEILDYTFKPNQRTLQASEIIPVIKFNLDNEE